jgi:segregation and condensation protein A
MSSGVLAHQSRVYTVTTPLFEGPLDLLLHLIERSELDITRLALAQITDQYLDYIKQLEHKPPDEVSAFIVIAARLVQIKSEALLPRPPSLEAGEEDPAEALARQLRIYRQFKQAAAMFVARERLGLRTHLRLAPPPRVEAQIDLSDLTIDDLAFAALDVFKRSQSQASLGTVVAYPKVTIREKISNIVQTLRTRGQTTFSILVNQVTTRLEVVVTFLAMLELVKRDFVIASQDHLFGDIALKFSDTLPEGDRDQSDFELEFGE